MFGNFAVLINLSLVKTLTLFLADDRGEVRENTIEMSVVLEK